MAKQLGLEANETLNFKTWVLRVSIHCPGCIKKVKKVLKSIEGVYRTEVDSQQHKVVVIGSVDSETLIKKLGKAGKRAEVVSGLDPTEGRTSKKISSALVENDSVINDRVPAPSSALVLPKQKKIARPVPEKKTISPEQNLPEQQRDPVAPAGEAEGEKRKVKKGGSENNGKVNMKCNTKMMMMMGDEAPKKLISHSQNHNAQQVNVTQPQSAYKSVSGDELSYNTSMCTSSSTTSSYRPSEEMHSYAYFTPESTTYHPHPVPPPPPESILDFHDRHDDYYYNDEDDEESGCSIM